MVGALKRQLYYSAMTDALFMNDPLNDQSIKSLTMLGFTSKHSLNSWMYYHYKIKDSNTCNRKLKWLLYEGYRSEYNRLKHLLSAMPVKEREPYIASLPESDDRKRKLIRINKIMPYLGSGGVAAYDFALYLTVAQTGVRLGYLAYREARVFSREIAKTAQRQYGSWNEYHLACIAGMYYLTPPNLEDHSQDNTYSQYMYARMLARRTSADKFVRWRARL